MSSLESEETLFFQEETTLANKTKELDFSLDSGMDDPAVSAASNDSDDEEIMCKKKVKKKTILDSEDEADGDDVTDPGLSNENKENEPASSNARIESEEEDDLQLNLEMDGDEGNDQEVDGSDTPADVPSQRMEFKDKDLFDAESGDEDPPVRADEEGSEKEEENASGGGDDDASGDDDDEANDGDGDEGFDESQIDPKLLTKLKKMKGASKTKKEKEKLSRKAKPTAEQMQEIYSESQRMVRESRINLPYYEPETKSLDDFLARASKKRQEYSALSKPKDYQKALIIHEKLSVTPPKPTYRRESRRSVKDKMEAGATSSQTISSQSDSLPATNLLDSGVESQDFGLSQASTVILPETCPVNGNTDQPTMGVSDSISDTLKSSRVEVVVATNDSNEKSHRPLDKADGATTEATQIEDNNVDQGSLQKDPSRDLFSSLTEDQCEEAMCENMFADVDDHVLCIEVDQKACVSNDGNCSHTEIKQREEVEESCAETDNGENKGNSVHTFDTDEFEKDCLAEDFASPTYKPKKQCLLEKLQQQGLMAVRDLPKLSGSPDSLINLDTDLQPKISPRKKGVSALMDRLVQHKTKKKSHHSYDVNLSIIEKEGNEGEKKELKLKSLTYHVEEEKEELPSTAPGSKLTLLKEKLGMGMKVKREEARQRRQLMFNMENEEGFAKQSASGDEEEEAEMTDGESISDDDETEDRLMDLMQEDDDGEDYNPLLDTEARDDDDEEEEEEDNFAMNEDSNDVKLRFEVSDEEEEEEECESQLDDGAEGDSEEDGENENIAVKSKRKKRSAILSDDEDSNIETKKLDRDEDVESLPDLELTPLTKHFQDTQYHRESSRSPELYGPSAFEESSNSAKQADTLNDSGSYNPHSQMLDADGYLKMTQTQKVPKSRISLLVEAPEDNAVMDGFGSSYKMTPGKIFDAMSGQLPSQSGDDMNELLGLCSGTFQQNSLSADGINPSQNRREDEEDLSNPFRIISQEKEQDAEDHFSKRKRIRPMSDSEEDEREGGSDREDECRRLSDPKTFGGFKDKVTKGIRKEFLEDEAELSGSEYDSDENLDLALEDDILEEEAGDKDMAGVSEEELRNQVGKVHMKQLLDDDDRAVMRYKEMYLQDGDLYTEGNGRMRNFRWKDAGDLSQQDMFDQHSDEEHVEDVDEIKWRKEKIEREKFLEESQQGDEEPNKELQKFGQLFVKRSDSTSSLHKAPVSTNQKPDESSKSKQPALKKKGSFLSRSKDAFQKFAQIAKTVIGGNSTQKSRSFVFQSKENQEAESVENEVEMMPQPLHPPKRKAHNASAISTQPAKKPKLTNKSLSVPPTVKRKGSIFNLLDK